MAFDPGFCLFENLMAKYAFLYLNQGVHKKNFTEKEGIQRVLVF